MLPHISHSLCFSQILSEAELDGEVLADSDNGGRCASGGKSVGRCTNLCYSGQLGLHVCFSAGLPLFDGHPVVDLARWFNPYSGSCAISLRRWRWVEVVDVHPDRSEVKQVIDKVKLLRR